MLTMPGRCRYRLRLVTGTLILLLAGCGARQVLHEFPAPLAPESRPPAAVSYTLRKDEQRRHTWVLRGERGEAVGTFRWLPAFRDVQGSDAPDRSEDFRRVDRFQDAVTGSDYTFRLSATSDSLRNSGSFGTAPPRVLVFDAASGERVGDLELRTGFERRYEGVWRGGSALWRAEVLPEGDRVRDSADGKVRDRYPAAQLMQWVGGSNAGLKVFTGRAINDDESGFAEPIHDVLAGRPLTKRELGDAVTLLFAFRALEEAAGSANSLGEM